MIVFKLHGKLHCGVSNKSGCCVCEGNLNPDLPIKKITTVCGIQVRWLLCSTQCANNFNKNAVICKRGDLCSECNLRLVKTTETDTLLVEVCHTCKTPTMDLILCPRCNFTKYCSHDCRIADWIRHSLFCLN